MTVAMSHTMTLFGKECKGCTELVNAGGGGCVGGGGGEGGPALSITMTLIFPKIVGICPLSLEKTRIPTA